MSRRRAPQVCPCGTGDPYPACCGRFLDGGQVPPTPELVMRSRYTAHARGDVAHLRRTWHPSTRPEPLVLDDAVRWTGLEVLEVAGGGLPDAQGRVAFRAVAVVGGRREVLEEDSVFVREDGRWTYLGPAPRSAARRPEPPGSTVENGS